MNTLDRYPSHCIVPHKVMSYEDRQLVHLPNLHFQDMYYINQILIIFGDFFGIIISIENSFIVREVNDFLIVHRKKGIVSPKDHILGDLTKMMTVKLNETWIENFFLLNAIHDYILRSGNRTNNFLFWREYLCMCIASLLLEAIEKICYIRFCWSISCFLLWENCICATVRAYVFHTCEYSILKSS